MASAGQHITSATGRPLVYSYGFDEAAATRSSFVMLISAIVNRGEKENILHNKGA
jgi:hypothetical protein